MGYLSSKDVLKDNFYTAAPWMVKIDAPDFRIVTIGNGLSVNFYVVGKLRGAAGGN